MASFTAAELAEAAGVPPAEVERLRALGVLEAREGTAEFDDGAVAVLRLVLALEAGGIPLEAVGRAVRAERSRSPMRP